MSDRTLVTLSIVAAVLVVVSFFVGGSNRVVDFSDRVGGYLVDLEPKRVQTITVKSKDESVKLERSGAGFVLADKSSYPAANNEVNRFLDAVVKIRKAKKIADNAERHTDLGVAAGDLLGEQTKVVEFLDSDGNQIVGLVVGDREEGGSGYYVRRLDQDVVYASEEYVNVRTRPLDFVKKQLANNQRTDISKVTVALPGGETYEMERADAEDAEIQLLGVPEGSRPKGKTFEQVFSASSYMNFDDFVVAASKSDLSWEYGYTVQRNDGGLYEFEIAKEVEAVEPEEGDDAAETAPEATWWIRARATYNGPANLTVQGKDDAGLAKNEAYLEQNKAVKAFNQTHQGWVYKFPSYKAESLVKPFAELIEDASTPEEVGASHILISYAGATRSEATRTKEEAQARAAEVFAKVLENPDNFAELAKEYSDGPSAEKGGDLGKFKFDAMAKPFSEAAFKLEVGAMTEAPVETEFGFHIIKRTE